MVRIANSSLLYSQESSVIPSICEGSPTPVTALPRHNTMTLKNSVIPSPHAILQTKYYDKWKEPNMNNPQCKGVEDYHTRSSPERA